MNRYLIRRTGRLLVMALSLLQSQAAEHKVTADDHPPFPPDTYAIQFLLRGAADRSPDHYLIALVDIASTRVCEGPQDNPLCTSEVRVIDLLHAKIPRGQPQKLTEFRLITGSEKPTATGSNVGARYLVVAVPFPGKLGVYSSTAMITDPSDAEVEHARRELMGVTTK